MSEGRSQVVAESQKKGLKAGAAAAAAVGLGLAVTPVLAVVAAVPAAIWGYQWWKHRAQNGIKF